jgi:hypothetical protein
MLRGDADMADRCFAQYQDGIKRMRIELINRDEVMRSI